MFVKKYPFTETWPNRFPLLFSGRRSRENSGQETETWELGDIQKTMSGSLSLMGLVVWTTFDSLLRTIACRVGASGRHHWQPAVGQDEGKPQSPRQDTATATNRGYGPPSTDWYFHSLTASVAPGLGSRAWAISRSTHSHILDLAHPYERLTDPRFLFERPESAHSLCSVTPFSILVQTLWGCGF